MEWRIKGLIERDDKVGDRGRDFARSIMRSVGVAQDTSWLDNRQQLVNSLE